MPQYTPQHQTDPLKMAGQIINPVGHILSEIEEFLCKSTELNPAQTLKKVEQATYGNSPAIGLSYHAQKMTG